MLAAGAGDGEGRETYREAVLRVDLERRERESAQLRQQLAQVEDEWRVERERREGLMLAEVERAEQLEDALNRALRLNADIAAHTTRLAKQRHRLANKLYLARLFKHWVLWALHRHPRPLPAAAPHRRQYPTLALPGHPAPQPQPFLPAASHADYLPARHSAAAAAFDRAGSVASVSSVSSAATSVRCAGRAQYIALERRHT